MSFEKLKRFDADIAADLHQYGKRLGFSKHLLDSAAATLLKSITQGDGGLWSDSFLITCLENPHSSLRTLFDHFPGYRTSLIAESEADPPPVTSPKIINASFQTQLTEDLLARRRRGRGTLSEAAVLEIEAEVAKDWASESDELSLFATSVSEPLYDIGISPPGSQAVLRMAYMLEDCIILALGACPSNRNQGNSCHENSHADSRSSILGHL